MSQKDTDLQKIKELIDIMKDNELAELEIKHGDDKIHLKRSLPQPPVTAALPLVSSPLAPAGPDTPQAQPSTAKDDELVEIKAPLIGTFYIKPSPDSEPYIEVGSHVNPQTIVCIIEAMKVMNEIKAETSGTIVEILKSDGQAIEYGQPIFKIKPD